MTWRLKGCPRCGGDLYVSFDEYGWFEQCLQCSYRHDLEPARVRVSRRLTTTDVDIAPDKILPKDLLFSQIEDVERNCENAPCDNCQSQLTSKCKPWHDHLSELAARRLLNNRIIRVALRTFPGKQKAMMIPSILILIPFRQWVPFEIPQYLSFDIVTIGASSCLLSLLICSIVRVRKYAKR